MIIQTVSLKDPNENYLSWPSDGSLRFDLVDLDPSCKLFMVPMGAGRTCLKGPNGKFVDLHGNRFRCDGTTTGVGFIFSDTTSSWTAANTSAMLSTAILSQPATPLPVW